MINMKEILRCFERADNNEVHIKKFNFMYQNADESSIHTIDVIAFFDAGVALGGTAQGSAEAKAAIGLGSMMIETVRLVKGSDLVSEGPVCIGGDCLP